jgi:hypothetical protein
MAERTDRKGVINCVAVSCVVVERPLNVHAAYVAPEANDDEHLYTTECHLGHLIVSIEHRMPELELALTSVTAL